jgi:hypothetical protein
MATDHQINIKFNSGKPLATWSIGGKSESMINAQQGDTLTFNFDSPDLIEMKLSDAVLFAGPRKHSSHGSPFHKSQIQLEDGSKVKVENDGVWGFSIAFTTTQDGVNSFYFLPDPELEVGSTGT